MNSLFASVCSLLLFSASLFGQSTGTVTPSAQIVVPRLIRFSGVIKDQAGNPGKGIVGITFTLHTSQADDASLWIETQNVELDNSGKYTVLLGSTKPEGLPMELFTSGEAQWLGIRADNQSVATRILLVSVPYALKAAEAETLAGHAASEFVTSDALSNAVQHELQNSNAVAASSPSTKPSSSLIKSSSLATSFVDTNSTQIVGVTQNGAGSAIRATTASSGANAIIGTNTSTTGTVRGIYGQSDSAGASAAGVYGLASATTGATYGVLGVSNSTQGTALNGTATAPTGLTTGLRGQSNSSSGIGASGVAASTTGSTIGLNALVLSPNGTAAVVTNRGSGKLISGLTGAGATEVFAVDGAGGITSGAITANAPFNVPAIRAVGSSSPGASIQGGSNYPGVVAQGGVASFADGPPGAKFYGGTSTTTQSYFEGDGAQGYGAAGTSDLGSGNGFVGYGGDGGIYERGGEGIEGQGGPGTAGGPGGFFSGGYGNSSPNSIGGPGIIVYGGTGNAADGDSADFYGLTRYIENNIADVVIGDPKCGSAYAGLGIGTHPFAFSNCQNYSLMSDGTTLYLNRPTNGSFHIRYNNGDQFSIAPNGTVSINGNLSVGGSISAGTKDFKIDDPLDPAYKFLYHTSVESPDMKTLYDGLVKLDARGEAWVTLPPYFEALNQDFRYMLTSIGASQPRLYIAKEVKGNRFKIAGGKANGKVSWQVTGIRHDAFAVANQGPVEVAKPLDEQGTYLHPELFPTSSSPALGARLPAVPIKPASPENEQKSF